MSEVKEIQEVKEVKLEETWKQRLQPEFVKPYMQKLKQFLVGEKQAGKIVYPKAKEIFQALNLTPFEEVKVVILGQDPYHGPDQAHGLCFSVKPGIRPPPSLVNIFKEIHSDIGVTQPYYGCLRYWAEQGVLLLNAVLTVQARMAASHRGQGWEEFTDQIIHVLNEEREHLVFMLWGSYAQKKAQFVDPERHRVLRAPHPSPLSAHGGFMGCRHFSQCNDYLEVHGSSSIDWRLPSLNGSE